MKNIDYIVMTLAESVNQTFDTMENGPRYSF